MRRTGVCSRPCGFLALRGEEEGKVPMQEACFRKGEGDTEAGRRSATHWPTAST